MSQAPESWDSEAKQRQRLPPCLTRVVKPIHPRKRGWSDVPDAVRRRERGHMHQHAGAAVPRLEWRKHGAVLSGGHRSLSNSAEKVRSGAESRNCREGSAAGRAASRTPECKHIVPSPWTEGDGRKIFVA